MVKGVGVFVEIFIQKGTVGDVFMVQCAYVYYFQKILSIAILIEFLFMLNTFFSRNLPFWLNSTAV